MLLWPIVLTCHLFNTWLGKVQSIRAADWLQRSTIISFEIFHNGVNRISMLMSIDLQPSSDVVRVRMWSRDSCCLSTLQVIEEDNRTCLTPRGHIPSLCTASSFPALASFPCVLVPPTRDAWGDAMKPPEERGNEETCRQINETFFPLKRHVTGR